MKASVFPIVGSAIQIGRFRRVARAALFRVPARVTVTGPGPCWRVRVTGRTHAGAAQLLRALAMALGEHIDEALA